MLTDIVNAVRTTSYTMLWYYSDGCVSLGLIFEAAGGSGVRYYLSNYLLESLYT